MRPLNLITRCRIDISHVAQHRNRVQITSSVEVPITTRTELLQWILPRQIPGPLQLGLFYNQKPVMSNLKLWPRLHIRLLIITTHDEYIHCALSAGLSSGAFILSSQPILVGLLLKTCEFRLQSGMVSHWFNKSWSNHKSGALGWKSSWNCGIYILIMAQHNQYPNTAMVPNRDQQYNESQCGSNWGKFVGLWLVPEKLVRRYSFHVLSLFLTWAIGSGPDFTWATDG